ncbi:MAG: hypothetical protein IPL79_13805 [Myxococcales bacterium]|nr:hypothetical protein [Myxococcales bacterium]
MALPKRSPVLGYNHNVRYRGLVFHVQTEDSGTAAPHIFTHLFHGGVIVHTRKHVYDPGAPEDAVKALMQTQHKTVLRELKANVFDDKIDDYLGATPGLLPRGAPEEGGSGGAAGDSSSSVPTVGSAADSGSLEAVAHRVGAVAVPAAAAGDVTVPVAAPRTQVGPPAPVAVARAGTGENLAAAVATAKHAHAARTVSEDQARNVTAALRASAQAAAGAAAAPRPRRVTDARTATAGGVTTSKQGVIVNAPAHVIGGNRPPTSPGASATSPRVASAPIAVGAAAGAPPPVEDRGKTVVDLPLDREFAKDIISEKSLDEVILAYLTDER